MKNKYTGLSLTVDGVDEKTSSRPLTQKDFDRFIKQISDGRSRFNRAEKSRIRRIAEGQKMVGLAFSQGVINEAEYYRLLVGININQGLVVNSAMYQRFQKVVIPESDKSESPTPQTGEEVGR
jgi:hypothetical protein